MSFDGDAPSMRFSVSFVFSQVSLLKTRYRRETRHDFETISLPASQLR
jgi:hypothetical protein